SILITRMNLADNLAASAHLIMGESSESTPVVLIRGAPVEIVDNYDPDEVIIPKSECMYMKVFLPEETDK
ncbi:MAG: coenzyme F420-0:L-glutamate ligase, partial [Candidatus Bathyarchaeota archaeon]|nr:coenzyme F420-0:L-glutamate ligase [Candidatus Bathyarchaeota archaeon]